MPDPKPDPKPDLATQKKRNIEIINEWLTELRKPEAVQVKQTLKRRLNDSYGERNETPCYGHCCLGVLAEVCVKHDLLSLDKHEPEHFVWTPNASGSRHNLTNTLAGFKYKIGLIDYDEDILIRMNDIRDKSFSEIAEHIEKNILPRLQAELATLSSNGINVIPDPTRSTDPKPEA